MNIEILWIARYNYKDGWYVALHKHDFFQIIYALEGRGSITIDDDSYTLHERDFIIIKPHTNHGIIADKNSPFFTLDIKFRILQESLKDMILECKTVKKDTNGSIVRILEEIRLEGMRKEDWFRQVASLKMETTLYEIIREAPSVDLRYEPIVLKNTHHDIVVKTKNFLENHFAQDIHIPFIAAEFGYSPEHLSKLFKQSTGETLHSYLIYFRIEKSQQMLLYSNKSIKEIAFSTGFKNIHHFSRVFKKVSGFPPATWKAHELSGVWKGVIFTNGFTNKDRTKTKTGDNAVVGDN